MIIKSFISGLEKDTGAVENAVVSELINGFVEGANSKTKMVKRTIYDIRALWKTIAGS